MNQLEYHTSSKGPQAHELLKMWLCHDDVFACITRRLQVNTRQLANWRMREEGKEKRLADYFIHPTFGTREGK